MARLSFEIADKELYEQMLQAAPEKQLEAVEAGADILAKETGRLGKSMMSGRFSTGETVAGIIRKPGVKLMDGAQATVTYEGMHSYGNYMIGFGPRRLGEIAFVNEYGARGKAPRPFNRNAKDNNEDAIVQKMASIINKD